MHVFRVEILGDPLTTLIIYLVQSIESFSFHIYAEIMITTGWHWMFCGYYFMHLGMTKLKIPSRSISVQTIRILKNGQRIILPVCWKLGKKNFQIPPKSYIFPDFPYLSRKNCSPRFSLRPLKIICVFQVSSLVPFCKIFPKTHTKFHLPNWWGLLELVHFI